MGYVNPDHLTAIMQAEGLTASESWLLTVLACHFPSIRPSYDRLVAMTKLSRATVIRLMNDLVAREVIAVEARPGRPNVYSIDFDRLGKGGLTMRPPITGGVTMRPQGSHHKTPGGLTMRPEVKKTSKEDKKTPQPPDGGSVSKSSSEADQAAAMLDRFYDNWGRPGLGRHQRRREIAKLASTVGVYGEAAVERALGRLVGILAKRFPACRTLGGGWTYLEEMLTESAKAAQRARETEKATADRRAREERERLAAESARASQAALAEQWKQLTENERNTIAARVSSRFSSPVPEALLMPFYLEEMERAPPAGRESLGGLFERVETKAG